ncbi:MAG: cupin domain-containing protein [Gaiellaceae bacterium]
MRSASSAASGASLPWWWEQWGNVAGQYGSQPSSPGDVGFTAESRSPIDIVVRRHGYAVNSHTGWHSHPGPVFITVTQGTLTYYEYGDRTCTPHVVTAGQGFVDDGRGHIVRNESGVPAQDVSVIIAPAGGAFRGELNAPAPHCSF